MLRDTTAVRRDRLAALVAERGFLRVGDASVIFGVSEVTVRADLSALEAESRVSRVHGGAMPPSAAPPEPTIEQALSLSSATKRSIGQAAAAMVRSGDSVILDVGSTALAVAEALVERADLSDVAIITNGLTIALALEKAHPRFTIVVTGGTLRPLQHSLVNPSASTLLESIHADIAFIGCNGVDVQRGVTNLNYPEAEVKRRMLQSSTRHVLLADGSKLGQVRLGVVGSISDFHDLVTGGDVPHNVVAQLRQRGLTVVVSDASEQ
ncbi:MAG: DeoR/GlpR transcriptional regulator [Glaciihabitans sp.]|nr:DeoR/GlpR transcriptional regulator [Glaciihabitans sp.]